MNCRSTAAAACAALWLCAPTGVAHGQAASAELGTLIRRDVKLASPATLEGAEISAPRATGGPQIGEAMACVRLAGERPSYLAVFFEGRTVVTYRRAVAVDHCETAVYRQLAPALASAGKPTQLRKNGVKTGPEDEKTSAQALPQPE
jgi:hypothetical protein